MPKLRLLLFVAILLVLRVASGNELQQVDAASSNSSKVVIKATRDPSTWFRVESQHLIVYSNDDVSEVYRLVNYIERLDFLLRLYLKPFLDVPGELPKLTLYLKKKGKATPGMVKHFSESGRSLNNCSSRPPVFIHREHNSWELEDSDLINAEDDFGLMQILWTYSDNFLYRHTRIRGPEWFMTGLVAYFGGIRFSNNQMTIGRDAGTSYNWLKKIDDGRAGPHFSFDEVLRFEPKQRPAELNSPQYYQGWEFLGRSFNLVHYLLSSEKNRTKIPDYLNLVADGRDPATAFGDIFSLTGRDLDYAMWRYRGKSLNVLQVDATFLPTAKIDFTRLTRIEGEFVLDNAAVRNCPTSANGKILLEDLRLSAAQAPNVDLAQLTLSRAQIDWGDPNDAIGYLSRAVEADSRNPELTYLLGLAYVKLAETSDVGNATYLASARAALSKAEGLAPNLPETSYAQFRIGLMCINPIDKDISNAINAWHYGHEVPLFARMAALAYAWLGRPTEAYQIFNTLRRNGRDPKNAHWAALWLARLKEGVTRHDLLVAMRQENAVQPSSCSR
jgi:tetratricopeptide (TPR) repeat protein